MVGLIFLLLNLVSSLFKSKSRLEAENAALRQQLTVLQRKCAVDAGEHWNGLATQHVVSRSVRDCAGILDCTAGPVSGDPHIAPLPGRLFLAEVTTDPGVLRVGFTAEGKGMPFEEESSGLVDSRDWVAMVTCPAYFGDRSFQEMKVPATALDTF